MMNIWLANAIENVKGFITLTFLSGVTVVLLSLIVIKKMKMPNNERRRRKIPMVRSRAYIQARKNSRKRKKKKG